jgi:hypothetical protein
MNLDFSQTPLPLLLTLKKQADDVIADEVQRLMIADLTFSVALNRALAIDAELEKRGILL